VALFCSYLTLCFLYHQGQWQIVLHPVHEKVSPSVTPDLVRFGPDDSGQPQLAGHWLSSRPDGRYKNLTILFLPGGDGSLADSNETVVALQSLGINVFAFDYRGYGMSVDLHPNQQRMTADSEAAWRYLTESRKISANRIIPYGTGVGASLAARLATEHSETPALILDSPRTDLLDVARKDSRSSLLPASLLFHERFPLAEPLAVLRTPKLLITRIHSGSQIQPGMPSAFATAADPKLVVTLPSLATGQTFDQFMTRFLDDDPAGAPVPTLTPSNTIPN
jgi:pimeloyl-ACP methyl ester carboxylesterase